jgi:uncharacterized membrane protein YfcA
VPLVILGALLVGLSLGMLGSGGSILTVPVLTYLVGQPEKLAIASSLAIVGGISVLGAIPYARRREIDWSSVLWFGVPGVVGAWLGAHVARWLPGVVQLLLFAAIMLVAAWRMFRRTGSGTAPVVGLAGPDARVRLVRTGLLVGAMTGVVGIGGGFLVVPALVLLVRLTPRRAVGTSLVVIASNALSAFVRQLGALKVIHVALDWHVITAFVAIGGVGSLLGNVIGSRLPQQRLRQAFAAMLVVVAVVILAREAPSLWSAGASI